MKAVEADPISPEGDTPEDSMADSNRIRRPPPEQSARALTTRNLYAGYQPGRRTQPLGWFCVILRDHRD